MKGKLIEAEMEDYFLSTLRLAWFIFVVSADQPSEKEKEGTY